jgi:hypothetical protein
MEMVERALSSQAGSGPGADVPGDRVPVYRLISEDVFDEAGPAAEYALRRNDRWYQLNVYADDGVVVDLELLDMGSNF